MGNIKLSAKQIVLIIVAAVGLAALVAAATFLLTRPNETDYKAANDSLMPAALEAQSKLPGAANVYFAAFSKAQTDTGSSSQATKATTNEKEAYEKAETAARNTLEELVSSRAANDGETSVAARQFADASNSYIDYFGNLVDSYGVYRGLFDASDSKSCKGILVGETDSLTERRDLLAKAIKNCRVVIEKLKSSGNTSYEDYAIKMDRRLTRLEDYSVGTAAGEKDYQRFTTELKSAQQKLAALEAKNASDKEYNTLTIEIKKLNAELAQSKSNFESAASGYISIVKELPDTYGAIFEESVPARQKSLESLKDIRSQELDITLKDKLVK